MGVKHTQQSLRASALIDEYCALKGEPFDCLESAITDLITDLLILAQKEGINVNSICRMAEIHVSAETNAYREAA